MSLQSGPEVRRICLQFTSAPSLSLRRGYKRASVTAWWIISTICSSQNGPGAGWRGGRAGKLGSQAQVSSPRVAFLSFQSVNLHILQHSKICRNSSRVSQFICRLGLIFDFDFENQYLSLFRETRPFGDHWYRALTGQLHVCGRLNHCPIRQNCSFASGESRQ
jgi:hypothetical protein